MKVSELIAELQKFPQHMQVGLNEERGVDLALNGNTIKPTVRIWVGPVTMVILADIKNPDSKKPTRCVLLNPTLKQIDDEMST